MSDGGPSPEQERDHLAEQCASLLRENERLRAALKPFAGSVYNDNGDMSVTYDMNYEDYIKAYFAMKSP